MNSKIVTDLKTTDIFNNKAHIISENLLASQISTILQQTYF